MSTETVGLLGTGAQDGHLDFHTQLLSSVLYVWPAAAIYLPPVGAQNDSDTYGRVAYQCRAEVILYVDGLVFHYAQSAIDTHSGFEQKWTNALWKVFRGCQGITILLHHSPTPLHPLSFCRYDILCQPYNSVFFLGIHYRRSIACRCSDTYCVLLIAVVGYIVVLGSCRFSSFRSVSCSVTDSLSLSHVYICVCLCTSRGLGVGKVKG